MYCIKYSILKDEFYRKIVNAVPNFNQLSPLQATGELITSANLKVNVSFARLILSCFDVTWSILV